jgi:hypothetical protein
MQRPEPIALKRYNDNATLDFYVIAQRFKTMEKMYRFLYLLLWVNRKLLSLLVVIAQGTLGPLFLLKVIDLRIIGLRYRS